ncbi:MAG: MFS transporter, partial [Pseudomonadales bacterium]|nr:MFS transporter [Pseudomonadales bacterium]
PNRMRAQFSALFLFTSNIFGLGLGTTVIALITDNVFADERAVGYSIAIVCSLAALVQIVVLGRGLKYFRASVS